jgi:sulfite reductase (ferredoxin)
VGEVSAYDLPDFTTDVLKMYLTKLDKYQSFSDYIHAEGKSDIAAITQKYKTIPEFRDDKNYYFDWGSEHIFSLAAKGVGECSAGLFDMIDVDMNTVHNALQQLETESDKSKINDLLYNVIYASSRMLLITRGAEPKNATAVFNEFIDKFIDAKLVSGVFSEIITIARDDRQFDFTEKKETILDLSQTVLSLYEGMDDSLQFKNLETAKKAEDNELSKQLTNRKKDFRGVACPMNFVKTKIELATLKSGDILEILLDDGEPIENVPGSLKSEGHLVLEQNKTENYWQVIIKKA